jgi:hypothetical protein
LVLTAISNRILAKISQVLNFWFFFFKKKERPSRYEYLILKCQSRIRNINKIKSMKYLIAISLFCFHTIVLYSQNVSPYQFEDKNKLEIDESVKQLLLEKNWCAYEMQYFEKGNYDFNPVKFDLKIASDYTFKQDYYEGDWTIENNLIIFNLDMSEKSYSNNFFTAGAFSIHEISADRLILVKKLSSTTNNRIIYFLATKEIALTKYVNRPSVGYPIQRDTVSVQDYELPYSQENLVARIRQVYFMRNLPAPKPPLSEWSLEELKKEWRQLKLK